MAEALASYGLLGDTRTAALVSERGSLDWLCIPRFDGDPVFGFLIDPTTGGRWSFEPLRSTVSERAYTDGAASIHTRWDGPDGTVTMREGMIADVSSDLMPRCAVVRHLRCTSGSARVEHLYDPRLGLPGRPPDRVRHEGSSTICSWGSTAVGLTCDGPLRVLPGEADILELRAGESLTFVFSVAVREPLVILVPERAREALDRDDAWWQRWLDRFEVEGPHRWNIERSLLTLRLLTYSPSGAPVAAPTTSLPAPIGGDRNWDYRFSWPRDACIGTGAFLALGSDEEPRHFIEWLVNASRISRPRLEVLYDLDGRPVRHERDVPHVDGYEGSVPVRVGNAAARQHQLDVYGWVLDAGWLLDAYGRRLSRPQWRAMRHFADFLAGDWHNPDNGIWEERGIRRHHVHSKLLAWTGLDRAVRLSARYPAGRRADRWRAQRDLLAREIRARGSSDRSGAYRRVFDVDEWDASLLILPVLEFEDDPSKVAATIDVIRSELGAGGALLYRNLGSVGDEGAFLPCSFWLVQALARTGRLSEAEQAFDELCSLSTSLGLYAEQIDPSTRAPLGNFPQAFTHATFLQATVALNEARGTSRGSGRTGRVRPDRPRESARRS